MESKNISSQSGRLLLYFSRLNKNCFLYKEAMHALPESNVNSVKALLSDMTRRGLLMRLKEGVYYIIPYEQDAATFMPDWHLIAGNLVNDADYYIGYYSALQIHNLITQPSLNEQVVVSKQIRPSTHTIKGTSFQFIYHNEHHFFGSEKIWIDQFNKVQCSNLEKTIIDCLFKPEYAGGIVEIARALFLSKQTINFQLLYEYAQRFQSQAVIKRLGFLLELLEIKNSIIGALYTLIKTSYVQLDTELPKSGELIKRWSIVQNIDTLTIKSAIHT